MANYANLLATIAANIYTNNNNEVTAAMVKTAVDAMVASLGDGYQFAGVATPATNPGTPDERVFYIASEAGTYTNFEDSGGNALTLARGLWLLVYDSSWRAEIVDPLSAELYGYSSATKTNTWTGAQWQAIGYVIPAGAKVVCDSASASRSVYFGRNVGGSIQDIVVINNFVAGSEFVALTDLDFIYCASALTLTYHYEKEREFAMLSDLSDLQNDVAQLQNDVVVAYMDNIAEVNDLADRYVNQTNGNLSPYPGSGWRVAIFKVTPGDRLKLHIPLTANTLTGPCMWGSSAAQTTGLVREGSVYGTSAEMTLDNIIASADYLFCSYDSNTPNPTPTLQKYASEKVNDVALQNKEDIAENDEDIDALDARVTALESTSMASPKLAVIPQYDLVAGELFELFYNGIFDGLDPENYDFMIQFSDNIFRGNHYAEKWQWMPSVADVGTYSVTILLYSSTALINSKQVSIVVSDPAELTDNNTVCLLIGDSLMYIDGNICGEVYRRLCSSDAESISDGVRFPAGFNKPNFQFIGTVQSVKQPSAWCVGVGGWTADYYNKESLRWDWQWLTCSHDKTSADQHSTYRDSQGRIWRLESIEAGKIKVYEVSGAYPSGVLTGELTWVSGGEHHSNIVISSAAAAPGNPFWFNGAVNFSAFAAAQGVSTIDYVVIELGTNNVGTPDATILSDTRTLIDNILASFPSAKICLMTTQKSARDGWNGSVHSYYEWIRFCARLKSLYVQIASEYPANVSLADMAAELDTDHCTGTSLLDYNNRYRGSNYQRVYLNNAVHPLFVGYCMMADTIVRDMVARLTD